GKASGQSLKVTPLGVGGFAPADNSYCLGRGLVLTQDFTGWHVGDHVSVSLLWALSGLARNIVLPHVFRRNFVQVRGPDHYDVLSDALRAISFPHRYEIAAARQPR